MTYNIYCVWDSIAAEAITVFASKTDGMAVRENMPTLARMRPLKDLTLYKIGSYDNETCELKPCEKINVSWEAYKFPEARSKITEEKPTEEKPKETK